MKFQVTQGDISAGIPGDCGGCPVAICINRTLREFGIQAYVSAEDIDLYQEPVPLMSMPTPHEASDFVDRFDDDEFRANVRPFSFDLEIASRLYDG